jgi:hypothetical protein
LGIIHSWISFLKVLLTFDFLVCVLIVTKYWLQIVLDKHKQFLELLNKFCSNESVFLFNEYFLIVKCLHVDPIKSLLHCLNVKEWLKACLSWKERHFLLQVLRRQPMSIFSGINDSPFVRQEFHVDQNASDILFLRIYRFFVTLLHTLNVWDEVKRIHVIVLSKFSDVVEVIDQLSAFHFLLSDSVDCHAIIVDVFIVRQFTPITGNTVNGVVWLFMKITVHF